MSGILLTAPLVRLPRLTAGAFSSVGGGIAIGANLFMTNIGGLTGFSNSAGTVQLGGWLPFASGIGIPQSLFEVRLNQISGLAGWSGSGLNVWLDLGTSRQWDGIIAQDSVSVMRMEVRLLNGTVNLATADYTITWDFT